MRIDEKLRNEVRRGRPGCKMLHHCLTPYPEITPFWYPEYFLKISWIFARAKTKAPEWTALPLLAEDMILVMILMNSVIWIDHRSRSHYWYWAWYNLHRESRVTGYYSWTNIVPLCGNVARSHSRHKEIIKEEGTGFSIQFKFQR